jgi:hypothetical protein
LRLAKAASNFPETISAAGTKQLRAVIDVSADAGSILRASQERFATNEKDVEWVLLASELQLHAARSPSFADEFKVLQRYYKQALGQLIATALPKAGKKPPVEVDSLAAAFIALVHGLVLQSTLGGSSQVAESTETLVALIMESLLGAAKPIEKSGGIERSHS